jgi:YidC/Oxa1 family membrane protein insertase
MDQRNLLIAVVLSLAILVTWELFIGGPQREQLIEQVEQAEIPGAPVSEPGEIPAPGTSEAPGVAVGTDITAAEPSISRADVLSGTDRVVVESPTLKGSISLEGGRIDDLVLTQYRETLDPGSSNIVLLWPDGVAQPYYANFGWSGGPEGTAVPTGETVWQANHDTLSPGNPVTLTWDNGQGLRFERLIELDENYMFTVTQRVVNNGEAPVTLSPYGLVSRTGTPDVLGFYILTSTGGWLGITDKYWLVALVPDQERTINARFLHDSRNGEDKYQTDYIYEAVSIVPGASVQVTSRLFAGAKVVENLDTYQENLGIPLFDRAVDFGWFYFLTKPFFHALHYFAGLLGNFGLSILMLTVLVKLAFFPLANKSYRAMAQMRKLQPDMLEMRERFGDDKQRLNQEMMALYKREGVNPMSGCLPVVIQIPVFFALYKVLFVSIEMRQAPFYGWIEDLSARDPTSVMNGFGLLPWEVPELGALSILNLGVWPIVMGLSMVLQHRLNPQPTDPMQAKIFMFMPIFFTFLLAQFPAGLVIYWTWNNCLSILQQMVIMKRAGVPIGRQPKSS